MQTWPKISFLLARALRIQSHGRCHTGMRRSPLRSKRERGCSSPLTATVWGASSSTWRVGVAVEFIEMMTKHLWFILVGNIFFTTDLVGYLPVQNVFFFQFSQLTLKVFHLYFQVFLGRDCLIISRCWLRIIVNPSECLNAYMFDFQMYFSNFNIVTLW